MAFNKLISELNRNNISIAKRDYFFNVILFISIIAIFSVLCIVACDRDEEEIHINLPQFLGNGQLEVLGYNFIVEKNGAEQLNKGVAIYLKNVTDENIGKAVFNIVLYDNNDDILDSFKQEAFGLKVGETKLVSFYLPENASLNISSFDIELSDVTISLVPTAIGNDKIEITNHLFHEGNAPFASPYIGGAVEIAVKNISGETISTVTFEALFYDLEGNVIDTVQHEEHDLKPNASRAVYITSDNIQVNEAGCYLVTIIETIILN